MAKKIMQLHAFGPWVSTPLNVDITWTKEQAQNLQLQWQIPLTILEMDREAVWPPPATLQSRALRLWEGNCLEVFIAKKAAPQYWEIHWALDGRYNIFELTHYRAELVETDQLQLTVAPDCKGQLLNISMSITLPPDFLGQQQIEINPCACLLLAEGDLNHFAYRHASIGRADFHDRATFTTLELN